jgi:uncharacterized repeat protein (TIGR03803 family)
MTKLGTWKMGFATAVVFLATAVAQGQVFTTLYSFSASDGAGPYQAALVQGVDGSFYGTASGGGANNGGTAFRITSRGVLTTLYNFCELANCADGEFPGAALALAVDGNFYGTALSGGANGWGTIFKMSPKGSFAALYSFCSQTNCLDGASPYSGLVQASDGNLYGTPSQGGTNGDGTVIKMTTEGKLSTIHSFRQTDGESPRGSLIQGTDGKLYGTTSTGGDRQQGGTAFRISESGVFAFVDLIDGKSMDGGGPSAGLTQGADGNFYGTVVYGGVRTDGSIFEITPAGAQKTLYKFCLHDDCPDGSRPIAGLMQATDGNFYGTTSRGGDMSCQSPIGNGCGTVFQVTPQGSLKTVHTFSGSDGSYSTGGLLQATNGILYGTTSAGGPSYQECGVYGCGTVFSIDLGLGPFVAFVRNPAKVGQLFGILGQGFTGTTNVSLNGIPASFTVVSDTFMRATVPPGATTGYVTVVTPSGTLTSNVPFRVLQ